MNKKSINIEFSEYNSLEDGLTPEMVGWIQEAEGHLKNAYAPYSNFKVSSVCVLENGEIIKGTNQENAAYPSGLCAERVAIFAAKSQFPNQKIKTIVITTATSNATPFSPCGSCRQVISEYENQQKSPIQIVMKSGESKIWVFDSLADLLPFSFDGDVLK